jgi:lactate dehydrogenase-like 2-hydroxyacid dehydrogenase
MGQAGQAIARCLPGFEAEIIYHDARPLAPGTEQTLAASYRSLEQAAQASDVLIVALPLNNRTRHLIDAELIQLMRPGVFVVNVGRARSWMRTRSPVRWTSAASAATRARCSRAAVSAPPAG